MKVSAAIITRNRSKQLRRCLASLVGQGTVLSSVIVVDNASEDQTKQVIASFSKKLPIKYFYEQNIGIPFARNKAMKHVSRGLLSFVDDDCEVPVDWVENIIKKYRIYPKIAAIQGWFVSKPETSLISILVSFNYLSGFMENIIRKDSPITNSSFYKDNLFLTLDTRNLTLNLDVINKLNINFNTQFIKGSDIDFGKKLIKLKQKIMFCPSIYVFHWERPSLAAFLYQRFQYGMGRIVLYRNWPRKYFPKRNKLWRVRRFTSFIYYCWNKNLGHKLIFLLPLFLIEKLVVVLGQLFGYFSYNGSIQTNTHPD